MKKLDKLVLRSFLGPFVLTFAVVEFILLTQYMLKYLEDLVGKDLGLDVFSELLFYFSLNMAPVALPLAVLLSSLMTFGNLGEHHELTAIKTSGISLLRILRPVFFFSVIITIAAFFFNNNIVPKANLKAYSLLWDIRQKKPSLDIKEGAFYNGLPGYSIKIGEKFSDGQTLKDIMIYDHTTGRGNTTVILADSGKMYTQYDDAYLVLELFDGNTFLEQTDASMRNNSNEGFVRQTFRQSKIVFNLSSFNLDRTREELFAENKMMKNISELNYVVDSLQKQVVVDKSYLGANINPFYAYFKADTSRTRPAVQRDVADTAALRITIPEKLPEPDLNVYQLATNKARNIRSYTTSYVERIGSTVREAKNYEIEIYRKFTQSAACLIMFLIGAPLGAIIRKGGLGVPVLISIIFFIVFYVMTILGEKWGREGIVPVYAGMWAANLILLPIGMFFLYQARNDSSLLELDFWRKILFRLNRNRF
ncbi:MAG: LptF/LptG family permease [Hymenobacteraceae bacterium]|nr:LptF/LptG family permease [Hymenobacteraceae bacterium]